MWLQEAKTITIKELVKLILKGDIKPKQKNAHKLYGRYSGDKCDTLGEAFEIADPSPYYRTSPVHDDKKRDAVINKIETKATQLRDKLMLSDAATALKLVEDFETEAAALGNKSR